MASDLIDREMQRGLEEAIYSGAVLLLAIGEEIVFERAYGAVDLARSTPVAPVTLFDLASLTKVLATTPSWMILAAKDQGILDRSLVEWYPELSSEKASITPRHLLAHASGLPAWRPYYLMSGGELSRKQFTLGLIFNEPLEYPPGLGEKYSDLGFMLLADMIERESGLPLDRFAAQHVFEPLGLASNLAFCPDPATRSIAHTRVGEPPGVVNDLNAKALGGVSGHAGLFGSARGVYTVARELLAGIKGESLLFSENVARTFATPAQYVPKSSRALGFDTPSNEGSSSGACFSSSSLGHTGFTGVSLWIDPEDRAIAILLTNRVIMGEADFRIKEFRPAIHDAAKQRLRQSLRS